MDGLSEGDGQVMSASTSRRVDNAHKIKELEVLYRWHPWFGHVVHVHEVIEQRAASIVRCSLVRPPPICRSVPRRCAWPPSAAKSTRYTPCRKDHGSSAALFSTAPRQKHLSVAPETALTDESGGNRYAQPTATAPHLDSTQLLLAHHLKALKLPTFLREYDKLAQQCSHFPSDNACARPRARDRPCLSARSKNAIGDPDRDGATRVALVLAVRAK
jgi:hypothetical protein